jgi:hypothetical protein
MQKGRGGLKRETRGGARRVRPLPFALALPRCHVAPSAQPHPPVCHTCREGAPLLCTRSEVGGSPLPPPPLSARTLPLQGMQKGGGGGARKVRAPQCAPLPPGSPRVQRGEDSLFAHVANWGVLPTCAVRALPLRTGHAKGGHNPPSPPFMRQDGGGLHVPPSPRNWAGSAGIGAPPSRI